ncbi:MAG: hypothetical protein ABSG68_26910 [Thermoguttaceae bacterium]
MSSLAPSLLAHLAGGRIEICRPAAFLGRERPREQVKVEQENR